jgi:putative FmdB family regulatory protein
MPIYEYKCARCGRFEVEQRMTDDPLIACPTCGEPVKKMIPRKLYIQFKGPGFHVNDYPSGHRGTSDQVPAEVAAGATATTTTAAASTPDEKKVASEI